MIKKSNTPSIADVLVTHRQVSTELFDRVNLILNHINIEQEHSTYYTKGKSIDGRASYHSVILFKMLLLQFRYGLSDIAIEENVKDRLSFSKFCCISMDEKVPDSNVLCRFRNKLSEQHAFEKILTRINAEMEKGGLMLTKGVIVDARVTTPQGKPGGKKNMK
jgi:IS5 family transposase